MGAVFVRGSGGAIFEMDVPAEGSNQRELYDQKIANGELAIVDAAEWVDVMGADKDGKPAVISRVLRAVAADDKPTKPARAPRAQKEPAAASETDAPVKAPTKKELQAQAAELGVDLEPKMTNAAIQATIDAHLAGE